LDKEAVYITGSCVIRNNRVSHNDALIWEAAQGLELPEFLRAAYDRFSGAYPKFHKMDNLAKLGWLAAEVLLQEPLTGAPERKGLVLANRSASLDTDLRYFDTVKDIASPALFVYTLPNIVMGEISIRHGFKGENAFFTTDTFDTAMMAGYVHQLFAEQCLDACLCGWVEVMGPVYEVILHRVERTGAGRAPLTAEHLKGTITI
jgi:hypothetical protein